MGSIVKNYCFSCFNIIIFICVSWININGAYAGNAEEGVVSNEMLIYTPAEMLSFDINDYLLRNAPHLAQHAEEISHWSGYYSISPKIIISLIEYQTGLISKNAATETEIQAPLLGISDKAGFSEQVKEVGFRLSTLYYNNREQGLSQSTMQQFLGLFSKKTPVFDEVYFRLFSNQVSVDAVASYSYNNAPAFQLPYPNGESWIFGGSHTTTGSGSYPQSSLDFFKGGSSWGDDTSSDWVVASNDGVVIRHSSCFIEVVHSSGWSTSYYHLDNIQVVTNQAITENTQLANYANTLSQALCNGGSSTGPHVHFSMKFIGAYQHLNGMLLSGYNIHTGRYSYDTDCNYFWLEQNGAKYCAWSYLYNPGSSGLVPLTPSSVTATTSNIEKVTVSWSAVSGASSYKVFRCANALTSSCGIGFDDTASPYDDVGGVVGDSYYYRVKACNAAGCSAFSSYSIGGKASNTSSVSSVMSIIIELLIDDELEVN